LRPTLSSAEPRCVMAESPSPETGKNRKPRVGKARGGRPNRSEALRRRIAEAGVDPALVDPRKLLAAIALDATAPATARVQACKALLAAQAGLPPPIEIDPDEVPEDDAVTRRALALMSAANNRTSGRPQ
jgi:hypothetical protein